MGLCWVWVGFWGGLEVGENVKLISFHPGTTDTALSKPFQATVPEGKLFTPEFVAERLTGIMDNAVLDGQLSYLDWDNKTIPW